MNPTSPKIKQPTSTQLRKASFAILFSVLLCPLLLSAAPKEGDLVQGGGAGIYLIRDGQRCGFPSGEVFLELGYKWDKVIKISDAELNAIPEGPAVEKKSAMAAPQLSGGGLEVRYKLEGKKLRGLSLLYPTDLGIKLESSAQTIEIKFPRSHMAAILEATK